MSFSAITLASSRAVSMCSGSLPPLEPQYTQILVRGVPLAWPLDEPLEEPFWPVVMESAVMVGVVTDGLL